MSDKDALQPQPRDDVGGTEPGHDGAVDPGGAASTEQGESGGGRVMVDPRGPRFSAAVTTVVLAVTLLTLPQIPQSDSIVAVLLLTFQALVFGAAAFFGLRYHPYGWVYRTALAPRLGPPEELEDEAPPRFAQQVGLAFVIVALVGLALGVPVVAQVSVALALAAAFLNAAFNFCLGCEVYLLYQRTASSVRQRRRQAGSDA